MNESTELRYQQGSSDKVYIVHLVEDSDGSFRVDFEYGRRGNTLIYGTKEVNISKSRAEIVYSRLIASKEKKDYEIFMTDVGVPSKEKHTPIPKKKSTPSIKLKPQLLNEISEGEAVALIYNDDWVMQEKEDGRRRLTDKDKKEISFANRKGEIIAMNIKFTKAFKNVKIDATYDGEDMGNKIVLFDILIENLGYLDRYNILKDVCRNTISCPVFKLSELAITKEEKEVMFNSVKAEGGEGVVFKRKDALYTPGRPASGGTQLKYKFTSTCSCIVLSLNKKRSMKLGLYDEFGSIIKVGNASIYANQDLPTVDDVVEIKYLYAYKGGSLYQPVFLNVRDDIDEADCKMSQLKYKKE